MPGEEILVAGLFELGKMGLQFYFQSMRLANKTPEEVAQIYAAEKAKFDASDPSDLVDV